MEYLIIIYKRKRLEGETKIEKLCVFTRDEVFEFIQKNPLNREDGLLYTVHKLKCVLDYS